MEWGEAPEPDYAEIEKASVATKWGGRPDNVCVCVCERWGRWIEFHLANSLSPSIHNPELELLYE